MKNNEEEYELMCLARERNDAAFEKLVQLYRPMFLSIYKSIKRPNDAFTVEDALHVASIGLYNAIHYYLDDRDMSLHNFIKLCVTREMRAWYRKMHNPRVWSDSSYLTTEGSFNEATDEYLADYQGHSTHRYDPQDIFYIRENLKVIFDMYDPRSTIEGKILLLWSQGYTYKEISEKLGIPVKKVDNIFQAAKKKLAACLTK